MIVLIDSTSYMDIFRDYFPLIILCLILDIINLNKILKVYDHQINTLGKAYTVVHNNCSQKSGQSLAILEKITYFK